MCSFRFCGLQKVILWRIGTMQSLQNQFVKTVGSDGAHAIAPYVKIIICIHSLCHLQSYLYLQMQNEATDYCCQNFLEKSNFNKSPCCRMV